MTWISLLTSLFAIRSCTFCPARMFQIWDLMSEWRFEDQFVEIRVVGRAFKNNLVLWWRWMRWPVVFEVTENTARLILHLQSDQVRVHLNKKTAMQRLYNAWILGQWIYSSTFQWWMAIVCEFPKIIFAVSMYNFRMFISRSVVKLHFNCNWTSPPFTSSIDNDRPTTSPSSQRPETKSLPKRL